MKMYIHLWYLTDFFLEWKTFQTKVVDKIKIYILCSGLLFFLNRVIYEILCNNIIQLDTPQMTIWHICIACQISKTTNTHSEYTV